MKLSSVQCLASLWVIYMYIYIILSYSGISLVPVILNLTVSQILKKKQQNIRKKPRVSTVESPYHHVHSLMCSLIKKTCQHLRCTV